MGQYELLAKVAELKNIKALMAEWQAQVDALEDDIKAEMAAQETDKLIVGDYTVTWTKYISHRLDTKTFKADHEDLYTQYLKEVPAQRFAVTAA